MSKTENMSKIVALNLIISLTMLIVTSGIDHREAHVNYRSEETILHYDYYDSHMTTYIF